jgi:thiosulfate dehydrogenase [quinone] large subunit
MENKSLTALAVLRISLGLIFLWAFFDKLFGLGFATCRDEATKAIAVMCESAWVSGGSPTTGFLKFGVMGPFASFYNSLSGNAILDWIFMIGLLGIGLGLTLGIAMKLSTWSGAVMLFLMWTALLLPAHHPFLDDHLIYAIALICLNYLNAGAHLGLQNWWNSLSFVQKNKWLE